MHAGDRKRAGMHIPSTTPIHTATSYFYPSMAQLDRVFADEEKGYCYARYDNPSAAALEELMCALESGDAALACASGMAANAMYGATLGLLMNVFEPAGVSVRFADVCHLATLRAVVAEARPGCIVMESISNPLLRSAEIDSVAAIANQAGAALVVDNTFATPLLARPLELGAHFSVHS